MLWTFRSAKRESRVLSFRLLNFFAAPPFFLAFRRAKRLQGGVDFLENLAQPVTEIPFRIMLAEFPHVADPPDVIADAIVLDVFPGEFACR